MKKLPINFTQNQKYDHQTKLIINKVCSSNSNCIDVGCHKGEVMDIFIQRAQNGVHYGFEPIPVLYEYLLNKYEGKAITIKDIALSNVKQKSTFNYVVTNPSYSGLIKRQYDKKNEIDQKITVQCDKLDDVLPPDYKVDFIKIDVEGGELRVLEGAVETIKKNKPVIIFEHGLGAAEFYDSTPLKIYDLLTKLGLKISTMEGWLKAKKEFSFEEFDRQFYQKVNYYFIAYP
ncbi:MAG: FkbM family methyltransferase [Saprospiraceae bacterium]|nr:FkbM family methyltransferase [Saprospiraceae bacterium]